MVRITFIFEFPPNHYTQVERELVAWSSRCIRTINQSMSARTRCNADLLEFVGCSAHGTHNQDAALMLGLLETERCEIVSCTSERLRVPQMYESDEMIPYAPVRRPTQVTIFAESVVRFTFHVEVRGGRQSTVSPPTGFMDSLPGDNPEDFEGGFPEVPTTSPSPKSTPESKPAPELPSSRRFRIRRPEK